MSRRSMAVMPSPVQTRSRSTIERAISAAAELLVELGEDGLRLQDVVARSGVSAGSLTHHFGSREGLIAAALMAGFDGAARQRAISFGVASGDQDRFVTGLRTMLACSAAGERDAWRLARLRVLAYAHRRPALRQALVSSVGQLEREMADRVANAGPRLTRADGVSPLALVVFSEAYSAGRIVDAVFGDPLPIEQWADLFARLVRSVVPEDAVEAALGPVRSDSGDVHARLALAPDERRAIPHLDLDENERRMLDAACELQCEGGADAVRVCDLVERTQLSRSWFARHFGEREELIDSVHLHRLIAFARGESAHIEGAFDGASDGSDLERRLEPVITMMSEAFYLDAAWGRVELIAAAARSPLLARQAAPIVHATLERMAAAIAGAQVRGLVHPDLPPRAVARFLWAAPLAFVLGEVVGVEWPGLHELARRSARTWIVPGPEAARR